MLSQIAHVVVALVEGVYCPLVGDLDVGMTQNKFSDGAVVCEAVHTVAQCQHKQSARAVQAVPRANQAGACNPRHAS